MKTCPNGHQISDDSKFCPFCGEAVAEAAPDTAPENNYQAAQQQQQEYQQAGYQQQEYQQPQYQQANTQNVDPRNIPLTGYRGQYRNPTTVLLLSIFTCGIYMIYWRYITSQDLNNILGYEKTKPSFELIGIICGVLSWINIYYIDEALVEIDYKRGYKSDSKFILWLLLSIFVGVGMFLMVYTVQERLNSLYQGHPSKTAAY